MIYVLEQHAVTTTDLVLDSFIVLRDAREGSWEKVRYLATVLLTKMF